MDTTGTTPESNFNAAANSTIALYSDLTTDNAQKQERDRRFKHITKKPQRYVLSALAVWSTGNLLPPWKLSAYLSAIPEAAIR